MDRLLEILLTGLLSATLFHAIRLERALGVLKRDRAALEALVEGFNESTRSAEQGIARLRATADGAGADLARQMAAAKAVREDLKFLTERGDAAADRLDRIVRAERALPPPARPAAAAPSPSEIAELPRLSVGRARSQAERDLMRALRLARGDEAADHAPAGDPAEPARATTAAGDDRRHDGPARR